MDREREYKRRHWATHKDIINQKRRLAYKEAQNGKLRSLLSDYENGLSFERLCDKYKVLERKAKNV